MRRVTFQTQSGHASHHFHHTHIEDLHIAPFLQSPGACERVGEYSTLRHDAPGHLAPCCSQPAGRLYGTGYVSYRTRLDLVGRGMRTYLNGGKSSHVAFSETREIACCRPPPGCKTTCRRQPRGFRGRRVSWYLAAAAHT